MPRTVSTFRTQSRARQPCRPGFEIMSRNGSLPIFSRQPAEVRAIDICVAGGGGDGAVGACNGGFGNTASELVCKVWGRVDP